MPKRKDQMLKQYPGPRFCPYCGKRISRRTATIDHIVPRSRGGTDAIENRQPVCKRCNHDKANMTADEYRATLNSLAL